MGNQERYADRFAGPLIQLYRVFYGQGANIIGQWSTEDYTFDHSDAVIDNQFVGLVLDQRPQPFLTGERIKIWLAQITPQLLPALAEVSEV